MSFHCSSVYIKSPIYLLFVLFKMYPFKEKSHAYKDALGLKHDKKLAIAKEHNVKQSS